MRPRVHVYFVYLMASKSRTLYCGITSSLPRRCAQHRNKPHAGFTAAYNCDRLVWFESHTDVLKAIAREKQIKNWRREKKIALIEETNPTWDDLSLTWRVKQAGPAFLPA